MTKEEAIKTLQELRRETNDSWYEEIYNIAIEALEQKPNEDCISRKWILDKINTYAEADTTSTEKSIGADYCAEFVKNAPSVAPNKATGEWTPIGEDTPKDFEEVLVSAHFMGCEHYGPDGSWCGTTKPHESVRKARYIENEWFCVYDEKLLLEKGYRVTAWQPLPNHYKEHENEIGKWIQGDDGYYYCSLCQSDSDINNIDNLPNHCENCGARME